MHNAFRAHNLYEPISTLGQEGDMPGNCTTFASRIAAMKFLAERENIGESLGFDQLGGQNMGHNDELEVLCVSLGMALTRKLWQSIYTGEAMPAMNGQFNERYEQIKGQQ